MASYITTMKQLATVAASSEQSTEDMVLPEIPEAFSEFLYGRFHTPNMGWLIEQARWQKEGKSEVP